MKRSLSKSLLILLVLVSGGMLLSSNAFAITPTQPYLDFTGNFQYSDGAGSPGPAGTKYLLDLNDANITQVQYVDKSFDCDVPATCSGTGTDDVLDYLFTFGDLSNDGTSSSTVFGPDPIQVSIWDPVSTNTYMTADLSNFSVDVNGAITRLNWNYDVVNLTNFNFQTGYDSSQYLTELYNHVVTVGGPVAMHMDFSFNLDSKGNPMGCNSFGENCDFSSDAIGSYQAKAVAPEPVSSILFLVGGATLAARRFRKSIRKNKDK